VALPEVFDDNPDPGRRRALSPLRLPGGNLMPFAMRMPAYAEAVLEDAPVAYWRLGEGAGELLARDSSVNDFPLTFFGGPTLGVPGLIYADPDRAYSPDVVTAGASRTTPSALAITGPLTIEAWIGFSTAPGRVCIVRCGNDLIYGVYQQNLTLTFEWFAGSFQSVITPSGVIAADPQPGRGSPPIGNHVVIRRTADLKAKFSVNGKLVHSGSVTPPSGGDAVGLFVGGRGDDGNPGTVDEVAIYKGALTEERILHHYRVGIHDLGLLPMRRTVLVPLLGDVVKATAVPLNHPTRSATSLNPTRSVTKL
jgi:hypothetical protein